MNACTKCGAATVRHTDFCLTCGQESCAEGSRNGARIVVAANGSAVRGPLVALLEKLTGQPEDVARSTIGLGRFELDAEATPAQEGRLQATLGAIGASAESIQRTPSPTPLNLRFRGFFAKLCVTMAVAGAAGALGVPVVPWVGALTAMLVVLRAARVVPGRLFIPQTTADRLLGSVEQDMLIESHKALKNLRQPHTVDLVRTCLDHMTEISSVVRWNGGHLRQRELETMDRQLHQLARQTIRLAENADRLPQESKNEVSERHAKRARVLGEIRRRLGEIQDALTKLRLDVLQGAAARSDTLAAARRTMANLQTEIGYALEAVAAAGHSTGLPTRA
jgi:hypothetical protein